MNIVIVNCFDTYEHRVELLHDAFIKKGHKVKVLTSNFRHFEKTVRREQKVDYMFFNAEPYNKNLSYQRLHSHIKLSKAIFSYLEKHADKVDILWVLVPPNSFVKDAASFKRNHKNVKLIFDLIDLWPETMPIGSVKNIFPFSIWRNYRDKNIRYADVVVTECALYQERLKRILKGIKKEVLYLARPLVPYEPHLELPNNKINLCYLGSINNIIDIDAIERIIIEIQKYKPVELHIVGDGEKRNELIRTIKNVGATVVFHGKVYDRTEKQRIFDSCQYGLNIMKKSVCVGLTMKSMDYMEFGVPMINNIQGDTWKIVDKYKIGYNVLDKLELNNDIMMRVRSREFFENNLTSDTFYNKLSHILDL